MMSMKSEGGSPKKKGDYNVGWGKPPEHGKFRDGNKFGKGRRAGSKNLNTVVIEALNEKVTAKVGGKTKKFSKLELTVHQVATKASQGDLKAVEKALSLYERYGPREDPSGLSPEKLERDWRSFEKYMEMKRFIDPDNEEGEGADG